MKMAAMATMMVMAGMAARAEETMQVRERTVTVCLEEGGVAGFGVIFRAKAIASEMFAGIGVTIEWRHQGTSCPAQAIHISLTDQTPNVFLPRALAYALPYEGTHIRLFYDRISANRVGTPLLPRLLAHVLVHEITHVLQGIDRHSDHGVMKARWTERDFMVIAIKPLSFADEDIDLIHRGLAGRTARAMVAMNASPPTVATQ
jgi:hypothetical protein